MIYADWLLKHGADLQVGLFFAGLLLLGGLERLLPRRSVGPRRRRWTTNATLTAVSIVFMSIVPISFLGAAFWAQSEGFGLLNQATLPLPAVIAITLLARGFISFFTHLLSHKVPWLWRLHRVHHLDTELDVSSTVRFHPLEVLVNPFIGIPIVVAVGLSPWVLVFYELLDATITIFSHANLRIPAGVDRWLRYAIVTPDLHRVHHSSWQPETDSNYGAVFPIWDLIFGTFRPDPRDGHEHMELGLRELREPDANRLMPLLLSPLHRSLEPNRDAAPLRSRGQGMEVRVGDLAQQRHRRRLTEIRGGRSDDDHLALDLLRSEPAL